MSAEHAPNPESSDNRPNPWANGSAEQESETEVRLDSLKNEIVAKIQIAMELRDKNSRKGKRNLMIDGVWYTGVAHYLMATHAFSKLGEARFEKILDIFCPDDSANSPRLAVVPEGDPYTDYQMRAAGDKTLEED